MREADTDSTLVLAIDTSGRGGSCALVRAEGCLGEIALGPRPHSETLLPAVAFLLDQAGAAVGDVDAFAVTAGPGAFTGLRIGVTTAKGLAVANARPLVMRSTLECLAAPCAGRAPWISPVLDARRGEVWAGLWRDVEGALEEIVPPCGAKPGEWAATVRDRAGGERVLFVGDGVGPYGETFRAALGRACAEAPVWDRAVRAAVLGTLALGCLSRGETVDPALAAPHYLRSQ